MISPADELRGLRAWRDRIDRRIAELDTLIKRQEQAAHAEHNYMADALRDPGFQKFIQRQLLERSR